MVKSAPMLSRRQTPSPARRASGPVLSRPGTQRFWQRCVYQHGEIALTLTALEP